MEVFDDFRLSDLWEHDEVVDTFLREPTFALELGNFFRRVPLPLFEARALAKEKGGFFVSFFLKNSNSKK